TVEEHLRAMEMFAELLARASCLCVKMGMHHEAQLLAERCSKFADSQQRSTVPPEVARWFAVCERWWGIAILQMASSTIQNTHDTAQQELRLAAIRHLVLACRIAAPHGPHLTTVIVDAAEVIANCAVPHLLQPTKVNAQVQRTLASLIQHALEYVRTIDNVRAQAVKQQLYCTLIQ